MPARFGPSAAAGPRPQPRRGRGPAAALPARLGLLLLLLACVVQPGWGQTTVPVKPAPARPGQRPGSAPTPPVRNISPDPRDPQGPPPPGARNAGQSRIPGASHKPVPDTLAPGAALPPDTSRLVNGTRRAGDSLQVTTRRKGQVETTIKYAAKDSIQFDVTQKVARLYSKASVNYGDTDLKAARITVNYGTNTMQADGQLDSLTRKVQGRPVLKDNAGLYTAGSIAYNFKTKKARVTEAVTTQGEGFVSAEVIKRLPNGDINGQLGRYTTCNLEHPHFYIQAKRMKVIPGDKVITGPFNLVIGDVPTPLGFLFGFFPTPNKNRGSGVLIPTFGQAADRGYYLTNGGYYFAPNDYIGVRLTGDIYAGNAQVTPGGWGATADIQYLKRYTYNGAFNFRFSNRPSSQILVQDALSNGQTYIQPPSANSFQINWTHSPVPKPGGGRFSASVSAGSSSFNKVNSLDARRYLATQATSSISYSKQIRNSPVQYDIKLSQSQSVGQSAVGTMSFTLPDVSLGVARQYPYQWFGIKPGGKLGPFYEQFTLAYNLTGRNDISNTVAPRALANGLPLLGGTTTGTTIPVSFGNIGRLLQNSRSGVQHRFDIGLGSYTLAHYFKLNPGVTYGEVWYNQRLDYRFSPVAQAVRIDTTYGFYRINNFATNLSLNTTFYGTAIRKGSHKIQAIRHKVTPSVNYSFSPDFVKMRTGAGQVYQSAEGLLSGYRDQFGNAIKDFSPYSPTAFNNYDGFLYGAPGGPLQNQVSFTLQNAVEIKVRDPQDTTGLNPFKKVDIIRNLDFAIGYDFARPTFKLSTLSVNYATQVLAKLGLSGSAQFDPYQRDSRGQRIDKYLFEANPRRLLRLLSASLGTTYSFNPTQGKRKSVVPRTVPASNDPTLGTVGPANFYADYVDFDIPWELSLTYSANYTTATIPRINDQPRPPLLSAHTISTTGSVSLTSNLKLSGNLNYDIVNQTLVYPNIAFVRDLHCWQITGLWFPFGPTRGYNFTIAAKSSLLQDLKLNRNRLVQYQ